MRKAGGVTAMVAGIFGVIAGVVTLLIGGVGSAVEVEGAGVVIGLGWGGVLFSFATIVLGAVSLGVRRQLLGVLLIACAVLGAVFGGTFVAVFMILALVGGVLVLVGARRGK